jgi:hypothetical protein
MLRFRPFALFMFAVVVTFGCGGGSDGPSSGASPPPGSCKTGGTATGSFAASCNQCGQQNCNAELSDKSGSGWAQQYFGGDGSCAAFTACTCQCLSSGKDPLSCATSACIANMTPACQAANQAVTNCLKAKCATECK